MIDEKKVLNKGMTKEKKFCPKCKHSQEYAGPIRCPECNVFLLTADELEWQKKNIHYSERGRDENAKEKHERLKDELERRGINK